jgi:hypothetical protein
LYKPSLDRDADYTLLLDKVGTFFFGEPVQAENKGLLESLFGEYINKYPAVALLLCGCLSVECTCLPSCLFVFQEA